MCFPVIRLLGGGQPIGGIDAPEFLLHFVPYYAVALTMAAVAGAGSYTFAAFALSAANFWIHILSTIYTVLRKKGSFVVTPKKGAEARQPRAVMPALVAVGVLVAACVYGLVHNPDAATINNVSFAARPHLDPDDRMLGGASEAARSGRGGARARRGRRVSRPVRDVAVIAVAVALGGTAVSFARAAAVGRAPRRARPPSPPSQSESSGPGRRRRRTLPGPATSGPMGASSGSIRGATPSARDRRTACCWRPPSATRTASTRIWAWTQNNLQRPDGLISFLWRDGHVVDPQAASDADLDASRALLLGACRFHRPALRQQAVRLGNAIMQVEVASFQGAPVLTAGPWAVDPADHGQPQLLLARHVRGAGRRVRRPPLGRPGGELALDHEQH